MAFRVTSFAIENQAIRFAARQNADIFRFQQQITSGLRFVRPSEDPNSFRQVASLNNRFGELNVELATIKTTQSILNNSVSQLQEVNNLITAASSAVQQGIQSTEFTDSNALALEIEGILGQLQTIANSEFNSEYLYGGTKTNRRPYTFDQPAAAGRSLNTTYVGSNNNSEVLIGTALLVDSYYNGQTIFGPGDRQATVIDGNTGAQTGTGTDTLSSRANLQVIHGTTTFGGTSGIAAGSSASESDTLIGAHQLTIVDTSGTGTSGTIALNNGEPIPFDNSQTDLEIVGPQGSVLHVDTSSITPGFSGTINLTASGFLSVDGGTTQTAIDFSSNQIVNDSISGGFVTINSSAITQTGVDYLDFPGSSDAFQVLHNIVEDLRNSRSLSAPDQSAALDTRLGELEHFREKFLAAIGEQSTSLRTLESVGFRNETLSLQLQNDASEIQATDFSEAAFRLTNAESLLQYTYAVTAQITSINILDFLR